MSPIVAVNGRSESLEDSEDVSARYTGIHQEPSSPHTWLALPMKASVLVTP